MMKSTDYSKFDYVGNVSKLGEIAFNYMMKNGMRGDYDPVCILGIVLTCADTKEMMQGKLLAGLRRTPFSDIETAIINFTGV